MGCPSWVYNIGENLDNHCLDYFSGTFSYVTSYIPVYQVITCTMVTLLVTTHSVFNPLNALSNFIEAFAQYPLAGRNLVYCVNSSLFVFCIITLSQCASFTESVLMNPTLIARFIGLTWGPSGADSTQVGPMLAPWILLSGICRDKSLHWGGKGYWSSVREFIRKQNFRTCKSIC